MADKSTLLSIVESMRDAGVQFGKRFAPPAASVLTEVRALLHELGINDPGQSVSTALATAASTWHTIADTLSGIDLNFTNPASVLALLSGKANDVRRSIQALLDAPGTALDGLGASGTAIKQVLPTRLLNYIIYEFIVSTHPKIGGAFLLLGVLRREFTPAGGNTALVDAEIRVFDLGQFVKALTHPRESFLTVMRWGTDDFLARPMVDGISLLLSTLPGTARGPENDEWPLADEGKFTGPPAAGLRPSARRTLTVPMPLPAGAVTLSFVGLHKRGLGVLVPNPVNFKGNILPATAAAAIFAVTPGATPASDPPRVTVLP